jgi:WD40 repeat protein/transcriptional regulator with XRE-family HTH domain
LESTFGQWIRRRRRLLDLTQKELAAQVGCSPVTIRKLEADERRASKQFVERLAQYLAIPTAEYAQFLAYARAVPSFEPRAAPLQPDNPSTGLFSPLTTYRVDWGDAPDTSVFYDRALELAQLQEWLLVDRCRLIAILGMGGIGKTSLATKVAHLLQDQFEVVIWRSLRTAPPVEDILDEFLRAITPDTVLDSPPKLARQLQQLLDHLRRRRYLLVLDNAEAVIAEGEHAGKYRAGFAGYGELLRCVGESSHQSCLLITSREALHELPMLHGVDRPVRVLHLSSLSHAGSCALLAHKGLSGKQQSWAALTSWYSGNPLVLQLVGETIRELFQGDIDRFLQHERALFSGVRELMAGQFARLAPLERDVVVWLAIGSDTGLFCMRRVRSEFPLSRLMTPSRVVWATCFSPDSSLIAGAGIDGTVRIWATESGRCLQSLTGHIGAVWALCFSPDGRLVASGGADGPIRYWDVQSGHCLAILAEHTQGVRGLCFSPSGGILASAGEDGTVRLWAGQQMPEQMRCVQILQEHSGMAWAVDISPDGAHLASGGHDRTVRLYDAHSGRLLKTLAGHTHYITQVCFRSDSSLLASSSYDGTVRLWDPGTGQCVRTLQGHTAHVWAAAFSPDGNVLASGSEDLSVRLWDVAGAGGSGQCLKTLRGYTNSLYATSFSPDGSLVAGGGHDLLVRLWDPLTGNCLAALAGHTSSIWDVNFSPEGRLLVSAGHDRIARVWDVASGRCVYEIETVEGCHATSFHPSARILATANLDGTLDVWDVHNWNLVTTLRGHAAEVWAISFSPDGRLVASASMDNSVRVWDWHSGQCLQTLNGHTSYVRAVKFSPDGALLASSSWDGTVRLWDVRHMLERAAGIAILPGSKRAGQMSVTVSPDGRLLASAGMDGTVCLWHMEDALAGSSPAYVLDGHEGPVYSVGFRFDGHLLASSSEDGTIRLWDVSDARRYVSCVQVLRVERPYARMDITGVTGLTQAQIASLRTLGAIEDEHLKPGTQS